MFYSKGVSRRDADGGAKFAKYARYLCVLFLAASFLVLGCKEPEEENKGFIPVGEWTDNYGGGYTITKTTVKYFTADSEWEGTTYPGEETSGTIEIAKDFSNNSGVLIIKIIQTTATGLTQGKYTCVYYKDYTSSHVFLANPIDATYAPIQKDTLPEAESTFNVDNVDTHVTMWGSGYSK
jgi:hypothetical protein